VTNQEPEARRIERTSASVAVNASIETCFDVGIDLAAYPDWVENLRSVEILTRDDQGRPLTARFVAEGLGRMTSYVLGYDLDQAPRVLAWSLVSGDLAREIEGRYRFDDATERAGQPITDVSYELTIDLAVPLPGFVKRRAEDKIVLSALHRFKLRAEELSGRT
jgi:uncharacterized membrane protein